MNFVLRSTCGIVWTLCFWRKINQSEKLITNNWIEVTLTSECVGFGSEEGVETNHRRAEVGSVEPFPGYNFVCKTRTSKALRWRLLCCAHKREGKSMEWGGNMECEAGANREGIETEEPPEKRQRYNSPTATGGCRYWLRRTRRCSRAW